MKADNFVVNLADGSRWVQFLPFICVSVCFSAWYLKNDADRITKPDTEM